jgi:uncharacterized damage-inducible protein DinB
MDNYLAFAARYNRGANRKLVDALSPLEDRILEADRGAYYKSLHGLFNHIVGGERFVLGLMAGALPSHPALAIEALKGEFTPGEPPFPVFSDAISALGAMDDSYLALASDPDPKLIATEVMVRGTARAIGGLLVSAFSHAAHHRGQVSQILDELKIDNDFYSAFRDIT